MRKYLAPIHQVIWAIKCRSAIGAGGLGVLTHERNALGGQGGGEGGEVKLARTGPGGYMQRRIAAARGGFLFRGGAPTVPRQNGGSL